MSWALPPPLNCQCLRPESNSSSGFIMSFAQPSDSTCGFNGEQMLQSCDLRRVCVQRGCCLLLSPVLGRMRRDDTHNHRVPQLSARTLLIRPSAPSSLLTWNVASESSSGKLPSVMAHPLRRQVTTSSPYPMLWKHHISLPTMISLFIDSL